MSERISKILNLVISFSTLVVLTVGLYFAWDQARKLKESIDASNRNTYMNTWNTVTQQWIDLHKVLIEHPETSQYINGVKPLPANETDKKRVLYIAVYFLDFMDNALVVGNYINDQNITHLSGWQRNLGAVLKAGKVLCQTLNETRDYYSKFTTELADRNCEGSQDIGSGGRPDEIKMK